MTPLCARKSENNGPQAVLRQSNTTGGGKKQPTPQGSSEGRASPSSPFPISRKGSAEADTRRPCRGNRQTTEVYTCSRLVSIGVGTAQWCHPSTPGLNRDTSRSTSLRRPQDLASERHCRCGGRGGGEGGQARAARGPAPPSKGVSRSAAKNNTAGLADYPAGAPHQAARRGQARL